MQIDFPYHIDGRGRTAQTGDDDHIRDLIEQVLFTSPGERVNRPSFGSGLMGLLFAPNSNELVSAVEFMAQGALQQWLGELIVVESVEVGRDDSALTVIVRYVVRRNQGRQTARFTRETL